MKREGRQHGMVRTFRILPSPPHRFINQTDSPPTAGLFTKVTSKPTNHSKFTGKCGKSRCLDCRKHPVCKSKVKSKGTHREKTGSAYSGSSATMILDFLSNTDHIYDDPHQYYDYNHDHLGYNDYDYNYDDNLSVKSNQFDQTKLIDFNGVDEINGDGDDEKDTMSFCTVGFELNMDNDDDWCLVQEI